MDLSLSETQEMFKQTARDFLAAEFPTSLVRQIEGDVRGYSPEIWKKMAELGWLGVPFPEQWGGLGGSLLDVAVLAEELAQAAALSPYVSTLLSGLLLLREGNDAQKERFLPRIATGDLIVSTALIEPSASYEPAGIQLEAVAAGDGYVLNGTKLFVEYASAAQELICVARSRSDALAWCVRLTGEHADAWLTELRDALRRVEEVRSQGPASGTGATGATGTTGT